MVFNTAASVLGIGRKSKFPLWPLLENAKAIRANCPVEHEVLLESVLAYYSIMACKRSLEFNDTQTPKRLMKYFPIMKERPAEYCVLKLKIAFKEIGNRLRLDKKGRVGKLTHAKITDSSR